jgi:hypothetical protein
MKLIGLDVRSTRPLNDQQNGIIVRCQTRAGEKAKQQANEEFHVRLSTVAAAL